MSKVIVNDINLINIARAIRSKNGESESYYLSEMAGAIRELPLGRDIPEKDINFYDYDGSLAESWTLSELADANTLPLPPVHNGLTCQGWNFTLAELKATNRAMNVGAMFIPDDGKTHLVIDVFIDGLRTVSLTVGQSVSNGVSFDWGDGSAAQTSTLTGNVTLSHTYATVGSYTILLNVTSGTMTLGDGISPMVGGNAVLSLREACVGNGVTSLKDRAFINMSRLKKFTVPLGVTEIGTYAFADCFLLQHFTYPSSITLVGAYNAVGASGLRSLSVPNSVTAAGKYAFSTAAGLQTVTLPESMISVGTGVLHGTLSLAKMALPSGITVIPQNMLNAAESLVSIVIPSGVVSVGAKAFYGCKNMRVYDFSDCTDVPTLANVDAFNNISADCKILIPSELFAEWSTATNWSAYAEYMEET